MKDNSVSKIPTTVKQFPITVSLYKVPHTRKLNALSYLVLAQQAKFFYAEHSCSFDQLVSDGIN
jgi:hypothetical protein